MLHLVNKLAPICCLLAVVPGLMQTANAKQSEPPSTIAEILAENPDPFIDRDLDAILKNYGSQGSGITFKLGGVPLILTANNLVSNTEKISGATGIIGDPSGFGFTISLSGDYLFAFDKSSLSEKAKTALTGVLELYHKYEGTNIAIEGHTDSKGTDSYNQKLSEQRANAVVLWFSNNGISKENLTSIGFGESRPIEKNSIEGKDNPGGRTLNRRVEIKVGTRKKVNSLPTVSTPSKKS